MVVVLMQVIKREMVIMMVLTNPQVWLHHIAHGG